MHDLEFHHYANTLMLVWFVILDKMKKRLCSFPYFLASFSGGFEAWISEHEEHWHD